MSDDKLAIDEARRAAQHESVKSQVEGEVQAEIGSRAATKATPGEAERIDHVAGEFRSKAVNEVIDTEREVERSRGLARVSQIVDYIFYATTNEAARALISPDILNDPVIFPPAKVLQNAEILLPLSPAGQKLSDQIWQQFLASP